MRWLLCDYGEVLSLAPSAEDRVLLEEAARDPGPTFWTTYWEHRPGYDRGDVTVFEYWTAVLGWRPDPASLDRLVARDVAGWLHPNRESLSATARAAKRGIRLAVLSNAPVEVAAAIDAMDWMGDFEPRLFSCHLRAVKPERSIYVAALHALGAGPEDVVFLDDRPANVAAARELGIKAELFLDPAQIDGVE
jgi:putative hydrolase of the HAD superfamily